jgi:hypothetical protein
MTFEERAHHHKKRRAAYSANKARTGPETSPTASETAVAKQHQEQVVDRVPTDGISTLTTPATPAPPGSVIRAILASNSRKKKTKSVTTPNGRVFTRECNNVNVKYQIRDYETVLSDGSLWEYPLLANDGYD